MAIICPAILAADPHQYKNQINSIVHTAHRIQIDLTDNQFAHHPTIKPENIWWPVGFKADIHLMYAHPENVIESLVGHKPHLVIVHAEADGDFGELAQYCHENHVKVGVALLQQTPPEMILDSLDIIDHILIFSGSLGSYGGQADLNLLTKVKYLKDRKDGLEIGWDGGINEQNISELVFAGVDVLNVGGYIQNADDPVRAFHRLQRIADETGTT